MSLPRVAIVGRPNVGKSSIMNMLAGRRVSITDDTPGTTRDRVSTLVTLEAENPEEPPIMVEVTDTGGYGVYVRDGGRYDDAGKDLTNLTKDIEGQIAKAVEASDVVVFVIDAQAGVTALDEIVAKLLREGGLGAIDNEGKKSASASDKVVVLANKSDGPRWETHAMEGAALGFGEPLVVSAKNNYRRREFVERLHTMVAKRIAINAKAKGKAKKKFEPEPPPEIKVAIVGKRNAGKSTLVNTLAGEDRVIVSEIAGTTRDAVDVRFNFGDKSILAIDTAGLRKKKSFADRIEWWALERTQTAIDRCDVAMLLLDATEPISHVDHQIGMMLAKSFRPCVIVVNKWDLAQGQRVKGSENREVTPEDYEKYLRTELKGLWYAPISFISAASNENVRDTIELAFDLVEQSRSRTTTGKLNRLLRDVISKQGPSNKLGTFAKILYVAQIEINPPTIAMVVNKPELFSVSYKRFLLNRLRDELPFSEVPIKLIIKGRAKPGMHVKSDQLGERELETLLFKARREAAAAEPVDMDINIDSEVSPIEGERSEEMAGQISGEDFFDEGVLLDAPVRPAKRPPAKRDTTKKRPVRIETNARTKKRSKGTRKN